MIRFRKFALLLAVAAAMFGACRKDTFRMDDSTIFPDPLLIIETDVLGMVLDESGNPVSGATIHLGTKQILSDDNGIFKLRGLTNAALPFVRVEKPGYFPSLVSFSAKAGSVGRLKATLRAKTLAAQLSAATGGTANIPGGGTVQFAANGFEFANGQPYNGPVSVYATYLDPSQPGIEGLIPGGFLGRSAGGENQVLTSFGMVKVLLETPGGQPLQISKPAEVTMPVPADRIANAPATIPLWYIDEATGYWKEEGSATLQGNVYVGTVTHFSWWNCDIGSPIVQLSGRVRIGSVHPYVRLRVTQSNGLSATTTPDANGFFSGGVPQNQTFLFDILDECGEVVYSATLGPFSSNTDIGTISVSWPSNLVQVQGSLVNCNMQPVTNGYASLRINGNPGITFFPVPVHPTNGTFSGAITNCNGTEVTLDAVDIDGQLSSNPLSLPVSPTVDFGQVIVCDNPVSAGITLEFPNGTTKVIAIVSAIINVDSAYQFIAVDNQPGGNSVQYTFFFAKWAGPMNPQWNMSYYHTTISGTPTRYDFEVSINDIQSLILGTLPGEQAVFYLNNVILLEEPSGIHYPQCKVTLSAILQ